MAEAVRVRGDVPETLHPLGQQSGLGSAARLARLTIAGSVALGIALTIGLAIALTIVLAIALAVALATVLADARVPSRTTIEAVAATAVTGRLPAKVPAIGLGIDRVAAPATGAATIAAIDPAGALTTARAGPLLGTLHRPDSIDSKLTTQSWRWPLRARPAPPGSGIIGRFEHGGQSS